MLSRNELRDAIGTLGKIVKGNQIDQKFYTIRGRELLAQSSMMLGGVPLDCDEDVSINADALERAVAAMQGDIHLEVGSRTMQLICGKTRLALSKMDADLARPKMTVKGVGIEPDADLPALMRACTSVIDEQRALDWQSSLIISKGAMIGIDKGQVMVCAKYAPLEEIEQALLPVPLVDLVVSRKTPPREITFGPEQVQVEFQDDSWVVSQLIAGSVPTKVFELMTSAAVCENEITAEQRAAIAQMEALGCDSVTIYPDKMTATSDHGEIDVGVECPVKGETRWGVKHLAKGMGLATHWDLTGYPVRGRMSSEKLSVLVAARAA